MKSLIKKKMAYRGRTIHQSPGTKIFHIVSEPGDLTRYDYWLDRISEKKFLVTRTHNNFCYPEKEINLAEIEEMEAGDLWEMARDEVVNPHTLAEVIAGARQIADGKF